MYCINCGIELSKGQAVCPICQTKVYHPDFPADPDSATYPARPYRSEEYNRRGLLFVITMICTLLAGLSLLLERMQFHSTTWSGYVSGGIILAYLFFLLPLWFKNPNPVIFIAGDFMGIAAFLRYVNFAVQGNWFHSFALPVVTLLGMICTGICALHWYLRRGKLYIAGGSLMALGVFSVYLEFYIHTTFETGSFVFWSLYPLVSLMFLGIMLIIVAIVKPFQESLRKYFHI